jgi:tRNA nucleotidyltransferase (CCA-adding enzyme)
MSQALTTTLLQDNIPNDVRLICSTLRDHGFEGWVVGGQVRDCLLAELNGTPLTAAGDWDVATNARPEQVQRVFRRVIPTGIAHGTVTVLIGKVGYEVTTFRAESTYQDGRRPDQVAFLNDISADLARRDFTVNALAYNPLDGRLVDPYRGADDLTTKTLRAVGNAAERFSEDGLRVLRAARFVASLGFELAPDTRAAIEPSLDSYRKVSPERIREEWLKAMKAETPSRAFDVMRAHGMLSITAPELMESVGCEQNRYHAYDVWGHTMACMDACPRNPILRMAGLLHDVGKPRSRELRSKTSDYTFYNHEHIGADMARPMLERLKFSNLERDRIVGLVRHHLICYSDEWTDTAVRRWIRRVTPELALDLYELGRADAIAKGPREQRRPPVQAEGAAQEDDSLEHEFNKLGRLQTRVTQLLEAGAAVSVRDLAIGGHELIKTLGLGPGPLLGEILRELLEEVTEAPERNTKQTLLTRATELARAKQR